MSRLAAQRLAFDDFERSAYAEKGAEVKSANLPSRVGFRVGET